MSNIKLSLLQYVDDVVTEKDARIAELEADNKNKETTIRLLNKLVQESIEEKGII